MDCPTAARASHAPDGGLGLEASAVTDLLSHTPRAARAVLGEWVAARGEPAYRVHQIVPRLWQRPLGSWDGATEIPTALRRDLAAAFHLLRLMLGVCQESRSGNE